MKKPLPTMPLAQRSWHCAQNDTEYVYRTWTMAEQEILVQVREEETDRKDRIDSIIQVVQNCVEKPEDFDARTTPTFIIESLFLRIYAISMGESHHLNMRCTNAIDKDGTLHECGNKIEFDIPLVQAADVKVYDNHKNIIPLPGGYNLKMRYPCLSMADEKPPKDVDASWIISRFLECIFNDDGEVWDAADYTSEEMREFMRSLGGDIQQPIMEDFFLSAPHIYWKMEPVKCAKCGFEHNYEIRNLNHVFR